jgi:hypothetical protein
VVLVTRRSYDGKWALFWAISAFDAFEQLAFQMNGFDCEIMDSRLDVES